MQLCQETNRQLSQRLLHSQSVKTLDRTETAVCNILGCDAYGCHAALIGLDIDARGFPKVAAVTRGLIRRLKMTRKGQFQVG